MKHPVDAPNQSRASLEGVRCLKFHERLITRLADECEENRTHLYLSFSSHREIIFFTLFVAYSYVVGGRVFQTLVYNFLELRSYFTF